MPRDGASHGGLDPSTSIISQDDPSQTWPEANMIWPVPQWKAPSEDPVYVKLPAEAN